ncbi:unnamed protein product [Cuscuta campestris]|uniref:RING-type domain-containing protein n=1 Tax=Cuscuta campestris TaxID=132261 RepID=A0A484MPT6_9ASTE|nr:unnamed protein product [Cuscuta campestris]
MLGESNNNYNTIPVFLDENGFRYPTNASNQLQLFGNYQATIPVGFSMGPTNYFGSEHTSTPLVRPSKCGRDVENIAMQHKLQISLNNNNNNNNNNNMGLDEADPPVRMPTHNQVSTGLRLSYDDEEHNSSVTSSGSMSTPSSVMLSLTEGIKMELDNQKREFDQYLKIQEEALTKGLREIKRRHMASFLSAIQKGIVTKLQEKDVELENINRKNKELVERMKQTAAEAQNWCYRAKYNESMVNMLKTNLQHAMHSAAAAADQKAKEEGFGDSEMDDATTSGIYPNFALGMSPGAPRKKSDISMVCRSCKSKEVSVLLMPCRHLCVCRDCEGSVEGVCPVCRVVITTSVQVYLS